ncbi:tripartite tricarboxylate transporter substrate binding protein [Variovorax sp. J2P1-59]|uniref:Bug family tripartite tricarboxylate transporter substrate binding protein n=1 Tax=Variovorax flavidus TaxID=3053501 RepID=UPI002575AC92|nr:tripartite tricarboxylate transporter substrate binding protein [Variovorax sp. J2P1-59]MDM0073795.1 tripartite tricarboxylate transporter substrate binding protein [Variovorax sp. J2P1-59]
MTRRYRLLAGAALALLACSSLAQTPWPAKPIKLVVPFPPGGGTDFVARLIAEKLTTQAGWVIVIDNKPGAGGNIGLDAVAKSAPDGYTIGLGQTANLAINPALYAKMPFDPLKDFAPIASVASQPVVLLVNASSPYKTLADVVAASKAKPESLRIGLAGNGTVGHLAGEMLERRADIKMLNVPYKGAGPAMTDLLGNQVELNFANTPVAIPQLTGGKVRALAISSPQRLKTVPQLAAVPTVAEQGYPGFDAITWTGLVAPAGTPPAVVERINSEVQKILKRPDVLEKLALEGSTAAAEGTPRQFGDYIRSEHQKWGALIRGANIKLD